MHKRPMCMVCLFLMLCLSVLDLAGIPIVRGNPLPEEIREQISTHPSAVICGEIQRYQDTEYSLSVYLKQVCLIYGSEQIPIKNIKVFLKQNTKENLKTGRIIQVKGELERVPAPTNPGEFDSQQYYACRKIYYFMKNGIIQKESKSYSRYGQFMTEVRKKISDILQKSAGNDAGIYQAMILGEKNSLDQETKIRYQMAGMAHILAISGLHISILGMGLFSLLKKLSLSNVWAGLISLGVILQYGMLTGSSVSAMRAVCMFVLAVGARILGRSYDLMTALAVSAILLLLDTPAYLYSSSFQLSFGAVVGLALVAPAFTAWVDDGHRWTRTFLSSFAVQITTLPILLENYGEMSIAGVFLNLLVLPTVSVVLICGICSVGIGFFSVSIAGVVLLPGKILLLIYEKLCVLAGSIPFCTWIGGTPAVWRCMVYYVILLCVIWILRILEEKTEHQRRRVLSFIMGISVIFVGIFLLGFRQRNILSISCLDIGQGDGIVIQLPGGKNILIDGGSSNKKNVGSYQILPYLKNQGISVIDGIMISHTDADHISGIQELLTLRANCLTAVKIKNLFLPDWNTEEAVYQELQKMAEKAGVTVIRLHQGQKLGIGNAFLKILAPEAGCEGTDPNEEGMVVELQYGRFRGLFTGDIGAETEKKLLSELEGVDFLKVGHHGSRYSTCQEFLDKVKPELAVISCSASNTYGHPSPETTERLKENGIQTEYTMKNGAITVCTDGKRMWKERFCENVL